MHRYLSKKQPKGVDDIIEKMFGDFVIKLGTHDIIFERPARIEEKASVRLEKEFQQYLGFHPLITVK